MTSLQGTRIDIQNIFLAKLLSDLRQDLDVYRLLSVNWREIEQHRFGKDVFGHFRRRALGAVVTGICKIYEQQGNRYKYKLNSIYGIMESLRGGDAKVLNESTLERFVQNYSGLPMRNPARDALQSTIDEFKNKHSAELEKFKEARDKVIAHSEFIGLVEKLPSYDVMETFFFFAADFYEVITEAFVGCEPDFQRSNRPVKVDLGSLLQEIGVVNVKTDFE